MTCSGIDTSSQKQTAMLMVAAHSNAQHMDKIGNNKSWELKKKLLQERNNPAVRAFLDSIALAEGTYYAGAKGYQIFYTGATFDSFEDHPGKIHCALYKNKQLCSSAAGRYMFLERTWNDISKDLDLKDFSSLNQDLAALYLLHEKNALDDIKMGNFKEAIAKVNMIWSPLPGSPHKQPTKKFLPLRKFFEERRAHHARSLGSGKGWRLW
jgi:muramidase (phage lysozyme)